MHAYFCPGQKGPPYRSVQRPCSFFSSMRTCPKSVPDHPRSRSRFLKSVQDHPRSRSRLRKSEDTSGMSAPSCPGSSTHSMRMYTTCHSVYPRARAWAVTEPRPGAAPPLLRVRSALQPFGSAGVKARPAPAAYSVCWSCRPAVSGRARSVCERGLPGCWRSGCWGSGCGAR